MRSTIAPLESAARGAPDASPASCFHALGRPSDCVGLQASGPEWCRDRMSGFLAPLLRAGTGDISVDNFVTGLMRMQGLAKAREILKASKRMSVCKSVAQKTVETLSEGACVSLDHAVGDLDVMHEARRGPASAVGTGMSLGLGSGEAAPSPIRIQHTRGRSVSGAGVPRGCRARGRTDVSSAFVR